ncbi:hypothetical protein ACS3QZ_19335, partial [Shimia sp. W99]
YLRITADPRKGFFEVSAKKSKTLRFLQENSIFQPEFLATSRRVARHWHRFFSVGAESATESPRFRP